MTGPEATGGPDPAGFDPAGFDPAGHPRARSRGAPPDAGSAATSLRGPTVLWLPALLGVAFLGLPLLALLVRAPWRSLPTDLASPAALVALRLSLTSATAATAVSLLLGVPLAWLLARASFPGKRMLRAVVTVPLVLPPVVGGVALLMAFGRRGVVGRWLQEWFGVSLSFTSTAVILAEAFVAMPFLVIAVEGALHGVDRRYEEAAVALGASRWVVFRRVTLPLMIPGVVSGAMLCWARALGEFGATITFAGAFPGRTETVPIAAYLALETDINAAVALSLVLLVVSVLVLVILRGRWASGAVM